LCCAGNCATDALCIATQDDKRALEPRAVFNRDCQGCFSAEHREGLWEWKMV
jgi:hypothetical protein